MLILFPMEQIMVILKIKMKGRRKIKIIKKIKINKINLKINLKINRKKKIKTMERKNKKRKKIKKMDHFSLNFLKEINHLSNINNSKLIKKNKSKAR
jgi:hypothetical protein